MTMIIFQGKEYLYEGQNCIIRKIRLTGLFNKLRKTGYVKISQGLAFCIAHL